MHGIWKCVHGTVKMQCKCPDDTVHIVACPPHCPEYKKPPANLEDDDGCPN